METEITWKPTGSEKIKMALDQRKEYKKYFGLWVALDDKDRVISIGKNRDDVFGEAENFGFWSKEWGIKLYKIYDTAERQLIQRRKIYLKAKSEKTWSVMASVGTGGVEIGFTIS